MKIKEQTCVIISSYPQNHIDNSLLGLTVESWKQQGYDICLVSHSPLNPDIQKAVKYYIYTDENEMLTFPEISNTTWFHGTNELLYQTNWGNTMGKHSYAILHNIKNSLHFLKSKHYTHFVYLEVDGFLTVDNHKTFESKLEEADFLNKDFWLMMEYSDMAKLPVTNFFAGNIDYFDKRLKSVDTPQKYLDLSIVSGGYSLESFFGTLFVLNPEGDGHIEFSKPRDLFPNDWFGISMNGHVQVPGLKYVDWWVDLVKDRHQEGIIYAIISSSNFNYESTFKIYRDGVEVVSHEFVTGPLAWFKIEVKDSTSWKLEHIVNNEVVHELEYSVEKIMNNGWSFLEFH